MLLQDQKIRALEELVETLQEHKGKRLSVGCSALLLCLPWAGDSWAAGLQGIKLSPVVGSGQLSLERDGDNTQDALLCGTEHRALY